MTDNEKLARWQGLKPKYSLAEALYGVDSNVPDYLNDDTAAMSLLDTLVGKKYDIFMDNASAAWSCEIYPNNGDARLAFSYGKPTRREAVVAAVLELIERGDI